MAKCRSTSSSAAPTRRCATATVSSRLFRSRTASGALPPFSPPPRHMPQAARHRLSERELHEYVAEVEGHDSQVTGVVGYFYAMYRAEVLARVRGLAGRDILEVGCGEGMMFDGTGTSPVQMDVSVTRVTRGVGRGRLLRCADGYDPPFSNDSFRAVLLVAVLEHTREPWRPLAEARRVLKPRGSVAIGAPHDR